MDEREKRYASSWRDRAKIVLVDGTSETIFYAPIMATLEFSIGLEPEQVLKTRISSLIMTYTGNLVRGKFREQWASFLGVNEHSSGIAKYIADSTAFLIYGAVSYATILALAGAELRQYLLGMPISLAMGITTGRAFGWFNDHSRRVCGCEPVLSKGKQKGDYNFIRLNLLNR